MADMALHRRAFVALAAGGCLAPHGPLLAQERPYPEKTVSVVIPFVAGGAIDVIGRLLAERLATAWKQTVIIENKPGAGGSVGAQAVVASAADGHTILFASTGLLHNAVLFPNQKLDPFRDLVPISQVITTPVAFVVSAQLPATNMQEFVKLVREGKTPPSYGSFGPGTNSHIYGEQLKVLARLDLTHVPYRGEAAALPDVISGNVAGAFLSVTTAARAAASGKARVLGVTGTVPVASLPGVQTLQAQGLEGFELIGWFGLFARAGTPAAVVEKISRDVNAALADPELLKRAAAAGLDVVGTTPAQFAASMRSDYEKWNRRIRELNIKVE